MGARARATWRRPVPDLRAGGARHGAGRHRASQHHRVHRVSHLQRRAPAAVRGPAGRRLPDTRPPRVQPDRRARHGADGLSRRVGLPRLQVRAEADDQGQRARLDVRPPRRLLVDDRVLEPSASGRTVGLPLHGLDQGPPDRGRCQVDRVGEEELPGRVRRLVRVRPSRARQGGAGRLGHHQLLVQRPLRPARGRGRAAFGVGALPSPRFPAAGGPRARGGEARGELLPRPPRAAELGLAADERDREGARTEDRPRGRGRSRASGRCTARRR
jgi:hypothetical protein